MFIKICGLRTAETSDTAARHGANAVGVVMSTQSPRHANEHEAQAVINAAKNIQPSILTVLVVREMPATQAAQLARDLGFDVLQLHGNYAPNDFDAARRILPRLWRATSAINHQHSLTTNFGEERLLIDGTHAGSGNTWDLNLLKQLRLGTSWLLAGGLHPGNVREAIDQAKPAGVDVSSGVESAPGVKDPKLIKQFIKVARSPSSKP